VVAVNILFMGSPEFAVPSLRALHEAGYSIVGAVTQPDRPAGRGGKLSPPAVKLAAQALGIEVFQPETLRAESVQDRLQAFGADLFIVAAYGRILPQAALDIPIHGCLNVHASLLPKWRGPSPISASIFAGDAQTGVSIMQLVRKMDAGPVLSRVALEIASGETTATLEPKLASAGAAELLRVLPAYLAGEIAPEPQDEDAATYCRIIEKSDGFLARDWSTAQAERAVRAYNPWPGAYVSLNGERLAIWQASVASEGDLSAPGTLSKRGKALTVAFSDGWLVLEEVQKPGGKRITTQQFLAGLRGELPPSVELR